MKTNDSWQTKGLDQGKDFSVKAKAKAEDLVPKAKDLAELVYKDSAKDWWVNCMSSTSTANKHCWHSKSNDSCSSHDLSSSCHCMYRCTALSVITLITTANNSLTDNTVFTRPMQGLCFKAKAKDLSVIAKAKAKD